MGTRGAYGFQKDGAHKITYNHYDSYPSCLGANILQFLKNKLENEEYDIKKVNKKLNTLFRKIKVVNENKSPTEKDLERYTKIWEQLSDDDKKLFDLGQDRQKTEYYALLRPLQGNLELLEQFPVMTNGLNFLGDSLFCEWAYIINLSTNELEIYEGFNHDKNAVGRYVTMFEPYVTHDESDTYYGVKLIKTIPFEDFKYIDDIKEFANALEKVYR